MGQGLSGHKRGRSKSKKSRKEKSPSNGKAEKAAKPVSKGFTDWRKKHKHSKGPLAAQKLPTVPKYPQNQLSLHKVNRIKDWALMEQEYLTATGGVESHTSTLSEVDLAFVDKLRGSPMTVGVLEDIVDDNHAIISVAGGQLPFYVPILSIVDKDMLVPNCKVLLSRKGFVIVGVLDEDFSKTAWKMRLQKAPAETFADIGGLDSQIQEIREVIELPITKPELFEEMGIVPQKGVILYGPPGTGKTLLAKAVANSTAATFLRVSGSELVQKKMGAGPKLVREIFKIAEEHAPTIIFIDEVDAVGGKRDDSKNGSDGEQEVQRTMLALLNELDGFDNRKDVRIILATNRIDCLDPALIRPGRIDRKIEVPLPSDIGRRRIFDLSTKGMNLDVDVDFEKLDRDDKDSLSGADINAMCSAAGLIALRERRRMITHVDFEEAKRQVLYKKASNLPASLYC